MRKHIQCTLDTCVGILHVGCLSNLGMLFDQFNIKISKIATENPAKYDAVLTVFEGRATTACLSIDTVSAKCSNVTAGADRGALLFT